MKYIVTDARARVLRKEVQLYETEMPSAEARFALEILSKVAIAVVTDAGEDAAGRQRMAPMPPDELVDRAFRIADYAFQEARRRGWMVQLPDLNEINEEKTGRCPPAPAAAAPSCTWSPWPA